MNRLARTSMERLLPHAACEVTARIAAPADRDFVMSLVPRLVASGLPPWRDPRKMLAAYIEVIGNAIDIPRSGVMLFVAEDRHRALLGFILLVAATDCYTHERRGYVAQNVVVDGAQEQAIEPILIAAAEARAISRGYRLLTPGEFWNAHPASAVCPYMRSAIADCATAQRSDR